MAPVFIITWHLLHANGTSQSFTVYQQPRKTLRQVHNAFSLIYTKLTDYDSIFQFFRKRVIGFVMILFGLNPVPVGFFDARYTVRRWGTPYLKFITKQQIDLKFGREIHRTMLKSDQHSGSIVADARIFFVGCIFGRPDINFWRHDVKRRSKDIVELYIYPPNISCGSWIMIKSLF